MNGTRTFILNRKEIEVPLYEKGDRVQIKDDPSFATNPTGTVSSTEGDGLFVNIKWDLESFPSSKGKFISLGESWLASTIDPIEVEVKG